MQKALLFHSEESLSLGNDICLLAREQEPSALVFFWERTRGRIVFCDCVWNLLFLLRGHDELLRPVLLGDRSLGRAGHR